MSISITTTSKIFNNNQNLIIVFSAFSEESISITKDNFVFIYDNDVLIGINIFNFKAEFDDIKEGYHNFSKENFQKIVKKFPKEMKNVENKSFFRIGLIKKIEDHPKSEKLKVLTIETKDDSSLTIITNLLNLNIGDKHLFAINNAFLATALTIIKSKVMGVESQGMICSYKSIGIDKEGIISIKNQELTEEFNF